MVERHNLAGTSIVQFESPRAAATNQLVKLNSHHKDMTIRAEVDGYA
jgi:hypothetical protein